ncbi:hypothetical protein [Serratia rubidaea]|uniref:HEAT repeat domain-containing protein n=1 Tax=Serratia rubidaea TaxID=61652 RepID=A0ABS0MK15_SERRU|nr:hypothetical protein [Serratia rubidaea]MBH1932686.1 hypothetical protein [Serratia rubidaea]
MLKEKNKVILSLIKKEISLSELLSTYDKYYDGVNICRDLFNAREKKDSEAVDLFLYLGSVIGYEYNCVELLNKLLTDTWHKKHEELVRLLSHYKDESSIGYLFRAASLQLDYLDYDEDHVLADKCIRALAKINTNESIEKIKELSHSNEISIKNSANRQLKKYQTSKTK